MDKNSFEKGLTAQLTNAINDYVQGEKDKVTHMDCLWGELYGSINSDLWAGCITDEQAKYLRAKYLFEEETEQTDTPTFVQEPSM